MNIFRALVELDALYEATEDKSNNYWIFKGKAKFHDWDTNSEKTISIDTPIQVRGKSESHALNNIRFVIRRNNNLADDARITLFNYAIEELVPLSPVKICPKCEKIRLTDGGYCPVCDDGEEDL